MKKNIRLRLIFISIVLFVAGASGLYVIRNDAPVHNILSNFQEPEPNGTKLLSRTTPEESKTRILNPLSSFDEKALEDRTNTADKDNLGLKKALNIRAEYTIRQQPRGNADLPVIPLEDQTDVPEFIKEKLGKRSEKMAVQGYVEADDYSVLVMPTETLSLHQSKASEPLEEVLAGLVFEPTSVDNTLFEEGEYLGHKTALGLIESHSRSSGFRETEEDQKKMGEFSRFFRFPELGLVKLTERFLTEDSGSRITPELMTEDINGYHAYYWSKKARLITTSACLLGPPETASIFLKQQTVATLQTRRSSRRFFV